MRTTHDAQKQFVYKAGRECPEGKSFATLAEVQAFVDEVVASDVWRQWAPKLTSIACYPKVSRTATSLYVRQEIALPTWSWNQRTVLHELAHQLCDYRFGAGLGAMHHGPIYCYWFVHLVCHFMGKSAACILHSSMQRGMVVIAPKEEATATCIHHLKAPGRRQRADALPGEKYRTTNRLTGALMVCVDRGTIKGAFSPRAFRWSTICVTHAHEVRSGTREMATSHAMWPAGFCPECSELILACPGWERKAQASYNLLREAGVYVWPRRRDERNAR